jgi:hypothetical protein
MGVCAMCQNHAINEINYIVQNEKFESIDQNYVNRRLADKIPSSLTEKYVKALGMDLYIKNETDD